MALETSIRSIDLLERVYPNIPELHDICPIMDLWGKDEYPFEEFQKPPFGRNAPALRAEGYERFISGIKDTPRNRTSVESYIGVLEERGYRGRMDSHSRMIEIWIKELTTIQSVLSTIKRMFANARF